jgi:hypothetical protein
VSVHHLAGICFGRSRKGIFVSLSVYFDGSGKEETHPVITIGGFLADAKICEDIEADWQEATNGKLFHLKTFGTNKCELGSRAWSRDERVAFLSRLAAIVNRSGSTILSMSLEVAPYNAFLATSPHAHVNGPAFSVCGQACIALAEFVLKKDRRQRQQVRYVFEKGDREHEISKMVKEWDDTNSDLSGIRGHAFAPKQTTLLQPADLIAGIVQRCVISSRQALPCLDNGFSRTALHNYERHYSTDGVTAAVVSGHDHEHCWIINPKLFTVLDRVSTEYFERNPQVLERRLKQSPYKPKAK